MEHPGQLDVRCVAGLAPSLRKAVQARRVASDHITRARRPLVERVLVDERPDLLVPAFDLLLGLDQPRQVAIASSMRG
ncbi:MAG TPA: hypothetical protein VM049_02835 [Gaiellaceae bacterium]|nr:hypothetical protein [Gaiellaceae bacterium]